MLYVICVLFNKQNALSASVVKLVSINPHDLGSSPRSSVFPYYFSINNHMQVNVVVPWYTFIIKRPRVQGNSIKGQDPRSMVGPSQHASTLPGKSQKGQGKWARFTKRKPPIWGLNPQVCKLFYYSLFLLYFFLLSIIIFT